MAELSLAQLGQIQPYAITLDDLGRGLQVYRPGIYVDPAKREMVRTGDVMNAAAQQQGNGGMFGYKIREKLFPGEEDYFRKNPHVTGMAAETGDVILNPYAAAGVNKEAVARNEALRLYMRDRKINPNFAITPEQRSQFAGTAYGADDNALRQTIVARIYSGDPSANATDEQKAFADTLVRQAGVWR